jgi:hypothetical protein
VITNSKPCATSSAGFDGTAQNWLGSSAPWSLASEESPQACTGKNARGGGGVYREKLVDMTTPDDRASDDQRAELIRQTAELKDVAGRVGLDVAFREPREDLEDATAATMFVVWRRGEPMPTGNDQSFLTFDQARDFIARYTDVPTPRDGRA